MNKLLRAYKEFYWVIFIKLLLKIFLYIKYK